MKELTAFAGLQKLLLEDEGPGDALADYGASSEDRIAFLCHDLLALGVALRCELPAPRRFVHIAAVAATEVARALARPGTAPAEAIDRLTAHQRERLGGRPAEAWKARGPEAHLARAFWQLCGLAREIVEGSHRDGQLEEHAADLANYLLFAVLCSGAWDLAVRAAEPGAGGDLDGRSERPFLPTPPGPSGSGGTHCQKGDVEMKPNPTARKRPEAPRQPPLSRLNEEDLERVQGGGWRFQQDPEPPPVTPSVG